MNETLLDNNKHYAILSLPRTGSTYLTRLLDYYCRKNFGYKESLKEYFGSHYDYEVNDGYIQPVFNSDKRKTLNTHKRILQKLELLKKYNTNTKQIIKIQLPAIINNEMFTYLSETYTFICLARKNRLDRALSVHLLYNSNNRPNYLNPDSVRKASWPENEFVAEYETFMGSLAGDKSFFQTVKKLKNVHKILFYEDISNFHTQLGIKDEELKGFRPTVKLPTDDKLRFFKNKEEIMQWWHEYNSDPKNAVNYDNLT